MGMVYSFEDYKIAFSQAHIFPRVHAERQTCLAGRYKEIL